MLRLNCILQDFRSEEGLYSLIQSQHDAASARTVSAPTGKSRPTRDNASMLSRATKASSIPTNIKGKNLFDSMLWKDPISTSVFYTFIASLRKKIREDVKRSTNTHRFIRTLRDRRKLVRCYTQNIDGLEARDGLVTDLARGKGNRARFTRKSMEKPKAVARMQPGGDLDGGCEVVQLHGDLETLRCSLCQQTCAWNDRDTRVLLAGKPPLCQLCIVKDLERQDRGKRGTKVGTLRPNIVLYGEEHPSGDAVGSITAHDLALSPDVLLILGTSLHVHGLKILVKEFSKSVHARAGGKGKVIFVNLSKPPESIWKDAFDYWVSMDCDAWVDAMRKHRPDLWEIQEELKFSVRKTDDKRIPSKSISPQNMQEDKENIIRNSDSNSSPLCNAARPMVLVTPQKKRPLGEQAFSSTSHAVKHVVRPVVNDDKSFRPHSVSTQLSTPPSTGRKVVIENSTTKRKFTLSETYDHMFETPSKRRGPRRAIWEDLDAGL